MPEHQETTRGDIPYHAGQWDAPVRLLRERDQMLVTEEERIRRADFVFEHYKNEESRNTANMPDLLIEPLFLERDLRAADSMLQNEHCLLRFPIPGPTAQRVIGKIVTESASEALNEWVQSHTPIKQKRGTIRSLSWTTLAEVLNQWVAAYVR